jgi:hypothetical protein
MHTIHDDIRREVARCVAEGAILHVAPAAERIAASNPASGLSPGAIASMLVTAGVSAAVPMEIEMPEHRRGAGSMNGKTHSARRV